MKSQHGTKQNTLSQLEMNNVESSEPEVIGSAQAEGNFTYSSMILWRGLLES